MEKEFEVLNSVRQFVLKYAKFENVVGDNANGSKTLIELATLKQALTELKQIKEAKPSEALKGLKHIKKYYVPQPCSVTTYNYLENIEQTLLKAQEQEKKIEKLKEWFTELNKMLENRCLTHPAQIELVKKVLEFLND